MRIYHLTEKDYKVGKWSGGTTTELFIWPKGADYSTRNFSFRISSAKIDLEESDFTPLDGVTRYITPLSGEFTLTHPNTAPVTLKPMDEPYRFLGETPTHSKGKATDFNLMLKGATGKMAVCQEWKISAGFNCLYAVEPTTVRLEKIHHLLQGELLVVFADENQVASVSAKAITCHVKL